MTVGSGRLKEQDPDSGPTPKKKGIIYKTIPKTVFPRHTSPSPRLHPALFVVPAQAGIQRMDTGFRRGAPLVAPAPLLVAPAKAGA